MSENGQSGKMTDLNTYCKTYKNSSTKYWYMFDHFACTKNDHQKQYYDTTYGEELDRTRFLSALQNGRNWGDFHIVYHMDHSFPTNMGASQRNKGELLSNGDIDELSDNSSKIIISGGCHPADFSRDCIAEHFLKKANGGAVAYIGNTDVGWVGDEYQFESFLNNLFNNLSSNIFQHTIGYTYLMVVKNIKKVHTKHRLHLLGDPTMPVWTATPQNLNVTITPATVVSGPNQITVKVNNLPLGQQALICLMKDEEGYATLTVNDTQPHTFTFTPRTSGTLNVTVTAHNFRPYEKTVPVQVNNNTAVYIADLAFNDGGSDDTIGDNNGQLDAGETIGLTVKLKNSGKVNYNQVIGTLRCTSPYITILNKQSNFGTIPSDGTLISSQTKFRFQIDKDAPEIHRNDLNGVKFFLDIKNNFTLMHTDTFKIDIFAPELELREQVVSFSGNKMGMRINLMNVGKSRAIGVIGVLSSENSNIISISRSEARFPIINRYITCPNNGYFVCELGSTSAQSTPLNMKLVVQNEYGKTWTFYFDPNDKGIIENLGLSYLSQTNGIELYWNKKNNAKGYNIYKSTNPSGIYTRLNAYPLISNYYKDESILPLTTYYYKVVALSTSMNPSEFSPYVKATSLCPLVDGFPRTPQYGSITNGAINIGDIDYNGVEEIFSANWFTSNKSGFLIGIDSNGQNLFGGNQLNSIGELSTQATGSPAIGDLYGKGEQNIVTATWKDSPVDQNSIACFSPQDLNEDQKADLLWQTYISAPFYRGVVLSNLDGSSDGMMEIVAQSNAGVPIRILDSNGNIKCSLGTGNYSKPAVADLDGDGDMEIIACDENGINIWHHDGASFSTNNLFWGGNSLLSSPVICDLNKDGHKEIIVAEKKVSDSHIYVIDLNGNQLNGWNGSQSIPYSSERGSGLDHGLSVGDIDGDGKLEIVALGTGKIKVWKANGILLLEKTVYGLFPNKAYNVNIRVPILADVDGDSKADIIYSIDDAIYALRYDGTFVEGFPLKTNNVIQGTLVVSDIDNDGKNEIIAADNDSYFYAWKTNGDSNAIEWGSERHDSRNTGEYGSLCQPTVVRSNTTWSGETPCGNVIVQSGTLTIPTGKSITLEKTSKIVVRPGATLVVDGGSILNAYIWALPESTVTIKNNGTIKLRFSGNLIIESGAVFNQEYGSVIL